MIIHGNESFGYAPIVKTGETLTFGTPVMLPNMISSTMNVEQTRTPVYADNKTACILSGAKVRTIETVLLYFTEEYAQLALGFTKLANGMLVDTGTNQNHCIFFETIEEDCDSGTETRTLHYIYDVVAGEPAKETTTDTETPTPVNITLPYSAKESSIAKDSTGKAVQYGYLTRTEENAVLYDTFKTQVILPTDSI